MLNLATRQRRSELDRTNGNPNGGMKGKTSWNKNRRMKRIRDDRSLVGSYLTTALIEWKKRIRGSFGLAWLPPTSIEVCFFCSSDILTTRQFIFMFYRVLLISLRYCIAYGGLLILSLGKLIFTIHSNATY